MYTVKTYVPHGYYAYEVADMEQAMAHGQAIMNTGVYRRVNSKGEVEFHKAYKVKVSGPDLATDYTDTFKRT